MRELGAIDLYDLPYESVLMLFYKPGLATRFEHLLVDDYECCTYTQAWMINRWMKSVKTFAVSCNLRLCTNHFLSYLSPKVIEIMRENPEMLHCTLSHDYRQKGILSKVRKTFSTNLAADVDKCSPMNVSPRGKVRIIKASSHEDEARKVAASIQQAHNVNQVDYADICVLFGGVGAVKDMFEMVLQQEGVPIKNNAENDGSQRVTVVTTNHVRGLEYRYVYLVCLNEGYTPSILSQDSPTDMHIEQRAFLLGLSRAKERLFMSASKQEALSRFVGMCFQPHSRLQSKYKSSKTKVSGLFFVKNRPVFSFFFSAVFPRDREWAGRYASRNVTWHIAMFLAVLYPLWAARLSNGTHCNPRVE